jgi:Uma2 family endonuclease
MSLMTEAPELIEAPLSKEELAVRYRQLYDDPCFANVQGKVEIDIWGRVMMTPPPAYYHGIVQARLLAALRAMGGGQEAAETPIATAAGVFIADVTWASYDFLHAHLDEIVLEKAPDICIEVVSPSNSRKELTEKRDAYLACGAREVWIVYPQSKRCEVFGPHGALRQTSFAVDLSILFN